MPRTTMTFYNEVDPQLKPYIRNYWTAIGALDSDKPHKIFPMDHIDMIIPVKGKYYHVEEGQLIENPKIVMHGIHKNAFEVVQKEDVISFGLSFQPWGSYPVWGQSPIVYLDRYVDFFEVQEELSSRLLRVLSRKIEFTNGEAVKNIIKEIEVLLCEHINCSEVDHDNMAIIQQVIHIKKQFPTEKSLQDIALETGITLRQLERLFNKYVGAPPNMYFRICQFERASREVLYEKKQLTDIAHDADYTDQAHFSKTFKNYVDDSPRELRKNKSALKSKFDFE